MLFASFFRARAVLCIAALVGFAVSKGTAQQAPWSILTVGDKSLFAASWSPEVGKFVTVGDQGVVYTSPDAINWTFQNSSTTTTLRAVAWGGGKYVAVGNSGDLFTSPDGHSWTPRSSTVATTLNGVAWIAPSSTASGFWAAVGLSNTILTSPDGVTWTRRTSGLEGNAAGFLAITWANPLNTSTGLAVAVGEGGLVYTSPDGNAWTLRPTPTGYPLNSVVWTGSKIVVGGATGTFLTTTDLTSWNSSITSLSASQSGVAYAPGAGSGWLVSAGSTGPDNADNLHVWSDVGAGWSTFRGATGILHGIVRGNGRFVAVGDKGVVAVSNDSVWTSNEGFFPAPPNLMSPSQNAYSVPVSPTFSWTRVSGVSTYEAQLSLTTDFKSILKDSVRAETGLVFDLSYNTAYSWRVRAVTGLYAGPWSIVNTLKTLTEAPATPVINTPSQNASGVLVYGSVAWSPNPSALDYHLQLALDSNFTLPVLDDSTLTVLHRGYGPLSYGTVYYARIKARTINGMSFWSRPTVFTTEAPPIGVPAAPTLIAPASFAAGVPLSPTFTWSSLSAATYQLQVSTSADFAVKVIDDSSLAKASFSGVALAGSTDYYWRVRAKNGFGFGSWSEINLFTTTLTTPEVPSLVAPAAFATEVLTPVTLAWAAAKGAATYEVQLSLNPDFSSFVFRDSTVTGLSKLTALLTGNTPYYWRVRARNSAGVSDWTSTRRFITAEVQYVGIRGSLENGSRLNLASGKLGFNLSRRERVVVQLFDLRGQAAQELLNEVSESGYREIRIPAGHGDLRILRFRAGEYRETRTLLPE